MAIDCSAQDPPRPPDVLIDRVTPGVSAATAANDRQAFDMSGQWSVRNIEAALAAVGKTFEDFSRALDFGCGPGRVLRWLAPITSSVELHGCDIDELAIAWDAENLSFCEFTVNGGEPPLPYPDEHFDLVLNHSVFTHLDERYQDLWLPEIRRVLRPGGFALLSVHGPRAFSIAESHAAGDGSGKAREWRAELEERGILFVADDGYIGSAFPDFYHTTFHAPWYVFEHWNHWFDVRAYLPHGDLDHQDLVVLERVDVPTRDAAVHARPAPVGLQAPSAAPEPTLTPARSSYAVRGLRKVRRIASAAIAPKTNELPAVVGEVPLASVERISPLVKAIMDQQGERIARVESEVASLRRQLEARDK